MADDWRRRRLVLGAAAGRAMERLTPGSTMVLGDCEYAVGSFKEADVVRAMAAVANGGGGLLYIGLEEAAAAGTYIARGALLPAAGKSKSDRLKTHVWHLHQFVGNRTDVVWPLFQVNRNLYAVAGYTNYWCEAVALEGDPSRALAVVAVAGAHTIVMSGAMRVVKTRSLKVSVGMPARMAGGVLAAPAPVCWYACGQPTQVDGHARLVAFRGQEVPMIATYVVAENQAADWQAHEPHWANPAVSLVQEKVRSTAAELLRAGAPVSFMLGVDDETLLPRPLLAAPSCADRLRAGVVNALRAGLMEGVFPPPRMTAFTVRFTQLTVDVGDLVAVEVVGVGDVAAAAAAVAAVEEGAAAVAAAVAGVTAATSGSCMGGAADTEGRSAVTALTFTHHAALQLFAQENATVLKDARLLLVPVLPEECHVAGDAVMPAVAPDVTFFLAVAAASGGGDDAPVTPTLRLTHGATASVLSVAAARDALRRAAVQVVVTVKWKPPARGAERVINPAWLQGLVPGRPGEYLDIVTMWRLCGGGVSWPRLQKRGQRHMWALLTLDPTATQATAQLTMRSDVSWAAVWAAGAGAAGGRLHRAGAPLMLVCDAGALAADAIVRALLDAAGDLLEDPLGAAPDVEVVLVGGAAACSDAARMLVQYGHVACSAVHILLPMDVGVVRPTAPDWAALVGAGGGATDATAGVGGTAKRARFGDTKIEDPTT